LRSKKNLKEALVTNIRLANG